ncbi:MAG: peptide-methionine (S)-S-oxide reductase MsrA [Pseudomonadota bacterium]
MTESAGATGRRSIVLAGGCFWCTEACYRDLAGVISVRPGYAGDDAATANYKACAPARPSMPRSSRSSTTPRRSGLGQILKIFFSIAHDPTQRDRQGNDVGRQYRSAIFYSDPEQKRVAEAYIAQLEQLRAFDAPIATEIVPLERFFEAEDYHHDYAARNPNQPYIRAVSDPKVKKLKALHGGLLKAAATH